MPDFTKADLDDTGGHTLVAWWLNRAHKAPLGIHDEYHRLCARLTRYSNSPSEDTASDAMDECFRLIRAASDLKLMKLPIYARKHRYFLGSLEACARSMGGERDTQKLIQLRDKYKAGKVILAKAEETDDAKGGSWRN